MFFKALHYETSNFLIFNVGYNILFKIYL
jgi:hypothetical protein